MTSLNAGNIMQELGPTHKQLTARVVRIESKLSNYVRVEEEEHELNGQMRVRVSHMEREMQVIKGMLTELTLAFKQFKREWDEEAELDSYGDNPTKDEVVPWQEKTI